MPGWHSRPLNARPAVGPASRPARRFRAAPAAGRSCSPICASGATAGGMGCAGTAGFALLRGLRLSGNGASAPEEPIRSEPGSWGGSGHVGSGSEPPRASRRRAEGSGLGPVAAASYLRSPTDLRRARANTAEASGPVCRDGEPEAASRAASSGSVQRPSASADTSLPSSCL
jgi:hypothetical protein